jgi:hypothetical protein
MIKYYKTLAAAFLCVTIIACEKEEIEIVEDDASETVQTKESVSNGVGGSLAQFTVVDGYLYTIDYKTLNIFDLSNPDAPAQTEAMVMGVGMETVFHQDGMLYVGANDGVHILDISDPIRPVEVSEFDHVTSCDPVVSNGQIAIATLRGGTECGGSLSQLDILDLSDISNPQLISEFELINPYGLGFSASNSELVYVCDGYTGLKIFNVSNPFAPELTKTYDNLEALDVISTEDGLIVLTRGGIHQFDESDPLNLIEKSVITVQ